MTRSSVVLPEPDGPSSATSSPDSTLRLTLSSAVKLPNFFVILRTSTLITFSTGFFPYRHGRKSRSAQRGVFIFHPSFQDKRDERKERQQRRHGKRTGEIISFIQNLHVQWNRIRLALDVAAHDRHR